MGSIPVAIADLSLPMERRYQLMHRTKQLDKMERNQDQVVYVFRTDSSKELGRKNRGEILSLRNGEAIPQGRQDKDENENRSCTYAFTRAHSSWRHLDDGATSPDETQRSSTQTSRPVRHLCGCRGFLRSRA